MKRHRPFGLASIGPGVDVGLGDVCKEDFTMTIAEIASGTKYFVTPTDAPTAYITDARGVVVYNAPMIAKERDEVKRRLASQWPAFASFQAVNSAGRLMLRPVRGAVIPKDCTPDDVLAVVDAVLNPDSDMAVLQPDKVA